MYKTKEKIQQRTGRTDGSAENTKIGLYLSFCFFFYFGMLYYELVLELGPYYGMLDCGAN